MSTAKTVGGLARPYVKKFKNLVRLRRAARIAQERADKAPSHNWVADIARPLGEALRKAAGSKTVEVSGPFGLGASCMIELTIRRRKRSITVRPLDLDKGLLQLVRHDLPHRDIYQECMMGHVNGLHLATTPIHSRTKVVDLLPFFR